MLPMCPRSSGVLPPREAGTPALKSLFFHKLCPYALCFPTIRSGFIPVIHRNKTCRTCRKEPWQLLLPQQISIFSMFHRITFFPFYFVEKSSHFYTTVAFRNLCSYVSCHYFIIHDFPIQASAPIFKKTVNGMKKLWQTMLENYKNP